MWNTLVNSSEEAWRVLYNNYKSGNYEELEKQCTCRNLEDIIVENTYGGNSTWEGKACRKCMTYEGPINEWCQTEEDERNFFSY